MTVETVVAVIGAITAFVIAITALIAQIHGLRKDLNGHVAQLVETSTIAAKKEGELEGRDFMHRLLAPPSDPTAPPHP